jgi:uncharacterized protein (DUF2342 family)|tara:strand:- start:79 stop:486 length:408 start_codon:yes stop_codon:yes gene_type:complete
MGSKRVGLARTKALIEGLKRDLNLGKTRLKHSGTVPTLTTTTAGNGTTAISATSTDVAGELTFANTWADGDTVLVTFAEAYGTAPKVILSNAATINASGQSSVEIDTIAVTTAGFTLTASGTCAGVITYFVVETA